jgi:hypothetical protein
MTKQSVFVSLSGVEDRSKTFSFFFTFSPAFVAIFFGGFGYAQPPKGFPLQSGLGFWFQNIYIR